MFSQIGPLEIIVVIVIVLLVLGPKRLPGFGKQLGTGMREFKDSITGDDKDEKSAEPEQPALTRAQADAPAEKPAAEPASADAAPEQRS